MRGRCWLLAHKDLVSFGLRDLHADRHPVGGHDAPERAHRIGVRALVVGVEAVAVGREHEAVGIDIAGGELQLGLHELLHLPFVGAAIPGHAEQTAGAPVADQIGLVQAAIIGDAEPLGRAAVPLLDLGAVLERLSCGYSAAGNTPTIGHFWSSDSAGWQYEPWLNFHP